MRCRQPKGCPLQILVLTVCLLLPLASCARCGSPTEVDPLALPACTTKLRADVTIRDAHSHWSEWRDSDGDWSEHSVAYSLHQDSKKPPFVRGADWDDYEAENNPLGVSGGALLSNDTEPHWFAPSELLGVSQPVSGGGTTPLHVRTLLTKAVRYYRHGERDRFLALTGLWYSPLARKNAEYLKVHGADATGLEDPVLAARLRREAVEEMKTYLQDAIAAGAQGIKSHMGDAKSFARLADFFVIAGGGIKARKDFDSDSTFSYLFPDVSAAEGGITRELLDWLESRNAEYAAQGNPTRLINVIHLGSLDSEIACYIANTSGDVYSSAWLCPGPFQKLNSTSSKTCDDIEAGNGLEREGNIQRCQQMRGALARRLFGIGPGWTFIPEGELVKRSALYQILSHYPNTPVQLAHMFDGVTRHEAVVTYFTEKFPNFVMDISSVGWTFGALAQHWKPDSALAFVEKYARPCEPSNGIPDHQCGRLLFAIDVGDYLSRANNLSWGYLHRVAVEGWRGQPYIDTQCRPQINDVAVAPSEKQRLSIQVQDGLYFQNFQTLVRQRLGQEGGGRPPHCGRIKALLERYFEPELTSAQGTASPILCSDIEARDYHYDLCRYHAHSRELEAIKGELNQLIARDGCPGD